MIFNLNSIILVTFVSAFTSSNLFDGVDAALQQQQQLRGRELDAPNFCPQTAPDNDSSCENILPRGWRYGDCSWSHSSWDGAGNGTTEKDYCICYRNVGDWQCTKNIETMTRPLATSPPPVTVASPIPAPTTIPPTQQQPGRRKVTTSSDDDSSFCPQFAPTSANAECGLTGMWEGTCWYSSSAQANETPNTNSQACSCKNAMINCTSEPYPKDIPATTPPPSTPLIADGSDRHLEERTASISGTTYTDNSSYYVPPKPNPYASCCKNNNGTYVIVSESDGEYGFCKTYSVWYKVVTGATFTEEQIFYDKNCAKQVNENK